MSAERFATTEMTGFRLYGHEECGRDGYPLAWHGTPGAADGVKHIVRREAGNRCERCGHPYAGDGEWSPCDQQCRHGAPIRSADGGRVEAQWRILTVHHLNRAKQDCRWWNLAALCQRCHLQIQAKVTMARVYVLEHSEWFKPHAAGWYAHAYLGEDIGRDETLARLEELLALERIA